jgi:hypothetical protein
MDAVQATPAPPLPPKRVWQPPPAKADSDLLLRIIHSQNGALAESQDLLHQRVDAADATNRRLFGFAEATRRLTSHREAIVLELARLIYDERYWELVPDSAPPGAEQVGVDLEALITGETTLPDELEESRADAVRDWLVFSEFAWANGIENRSTVSRWARGEHLPTIPAHRPWEADAVPIDSSLGQNYRRIWIPGVKNSFWPTPSARQRVATLLRHWPQRQGWTNGEKPGPRCMAPLTGLPQPFLDRYSRSQGKE